MKKLSIADIGMDKVSIADIGMDKVAIYCWYWYG